MTRRGLAARPPHVHGKSWLAARDDGTAGSDEDDHRLPASFAHPLLHHQVDIGTRSGVDDSGQSELRVEVTRLFARDNDDAGVGRGGQGDQGPSHEEGQAVPRRGEAGRG